MDKAKDADERFRAFIQSVFEKKVVSSVFLTGEGFENNWYPLSLKVLCNGRRAFIGNIYIVKVPAIMRGIRPEKGMKSRFIWMTAR